MPSRNSEVVRFRIQRNDHAALKAYAAQRGQPLSIVLREALAQSPLLAGLRFGVGAQATPVAPLFASAPETPGPVQPLVRPHRLPRAPGSTQASVLRRSARDGERGGLLSDTV